MLSVSPSPAFHPWYHPKLHSQNKRLWCQDPIGHSILLAGSEVGLGREKSTIGSLLTSASIGWSGSAGTESSRWSLVLGGGTVTVAGAGWTSAAWATWTGDGVLAGGLATGAVEGRLFAAGALGLGSAGTHVSFCFGIVMVLEDLPDTALAGLLAAGTWRDHFDVWGCCFDWIVGWNYFQVFDFFWSEQWGLYGLMMEISLWDIYSFILFSYHWYLIIMTRGCDLERQTTGQQKCKSYHWLLKGKASQCLNRNLLELCLQPLTAETFQILVWEHMTTRGCSAFWVVDFNSS